MGKASIGNLIKGIAFIIIGMALALLIWNLLVGFEIVRYISYSRIPISQLIPILGSVPGIIVFIIWWFGRKAKGERTQILDTSLYHYGVSLVIALALDIVGGIIGVWLVGFRYVMDALFAFGITIALQVLFCWLAFQFSAPYPRGRH